VVGDDPTAGGPDPEEFLADQGAILCDQIVTVVPDWVRREVERLLDAWGTTATGATLDRTALRAEARQAGEAAAADLAARLRDLLSASVDEQSTTPLELVRRAVVYPTAVLREAGVPPVVRDAFEEARFPDDPYGLTPASLSAVDGSLTDPARAWGAAKAMAHMSRHRDPDG
jgi:hypothetical protein